ncbi:MAG: glycosyltransferase family 4 protein, partial [Candidatus Omnitrophica bacterium]|nr:glycosyltransferase family 4 protein [Candidatus Omnitrophota bacterium]
MKILIIHPKFYIYGGAELVIVRLANYLSKNNIGCAILTTEMLPQVKEELINTEVITVKPPEIRPRDLAEFIALRRKVKELSGRFDVLNPHNYPAQLSLIFSHKPNVWLCNEPTDIAVGASVKGSLLIRIVRYFFIVLDRFTVKRFIRKAVVADESNRMRFKANYGFNPHIIPYGIDYDFFSQPQNDVEIKGLDIKGGFILLQVGTITEFKNQLRSLEALKKLKDEISGIRLVLAGWGDGLYMKKLQNYIESNSLSNDVIITGHLNKYDLRKLYWRADLLLHPIKPQGGWLAPFEALCAERPVVVSPEMTASEIIKV